MDGVLTILDEPTIGSVDLANPMPHDSLPSPDPNDAQPADDDARSANHADRSADGQPTEIVPMRVVEAILFAADSPLPPARIASILGVGDARDIRKHIATLNERYEENGTAFRIEEIAGGYRMMTLPCYNRWLTQLLRARQETKLTGAAMETLAIVAYKQPCTRADIESVRGVAAGDILNRLREMNLIKIVGRAEDLGRPLLYGTTKRFLEVFGLAGLEDLPQVDALRGGGRSSMATPPNPVQDPFSDHSEPDHGAIRLAPDPPMHDVNDDAVDESSPGGELSTNELGRLPLEASADLATPQGHAEDHPPPKAVVTRRPRRAKKADPDSTTD